ncbi:MAG: MBL fold metallo-hydrolase [Clostridia bacterium]|nr:MBL fold metallo-hydrolase [Clostridia bacterium]
MFEVKHLKGNTYYFEAFTNVGIYRLDDKRVVLIDGSDHKRMAKSINKYLDSEGLVIDTIICTHCHIDHIFGNKDFYEKHGCKILSTEKERHFIAEPDLEPSFYYAGIDTDKSRNPFFMTEPSVIDTLTQENLPEGLSIISLPGHSFDMIGVRTDDDVVFLADSILSEKTWREHKVPFFHSVNESIETLKKIKEMKAEVFVPSHNPPVTEIASLAELNINKLEELKGIIYSFCTNRGFDDMFALLMNRLELNIRAEKYPNYAVMVRNILQALVEEDKIKTFMHEGRLLYTHK